MFGILTIHAELQLTRILKRDKFRAKQALEMQKKTVYYSDSEMVAKMIYSFYHIGGSWKNLSAQEQEDLKKLGVRIILKLKSRT